MEVRGFFKGCLPGGRERDDVAAAAVAAVAVVVEDNDGVEKFGLL